MLRLCIRNRYGLPMIKNKTEVVELNASEKCHLKTTNEETNLKLAKYVILERLTRRNKLRFKFTELDSINRWRI